MGSNITYTTDTANICLDELDKCHSESIGPFFVVSILFQCFNINFNLNIEKNVNKLFLSHKYGSAVLPNVINEPEFNKIREELRSIKFNEIKLDNKIYENSLDLIDYFYRLNKNEKPYTYRLIEADRVLKEINIKVKINLIFIEYACDSKDLNKTKRKARGERTAERKDILDELDNAYLRVKILIQKTASSLYKKLMINEEQKRKYFASSKLFKQEIKNIIQKCNNIYCFFSSYRTRNKSSLVQVKQPRVKTKMYHSNARHRGHIRCIS